VRNVGNGELDVGFRGPCPVDQVLHTRKGLSRPASTPAEIVKPELDEAEIWLEGGDLLSDEVLGLEGLASVRSEVV
jgi:hypothetical protein